jgi:hypothetical protein
MKENSYVPDWIRYHWSCISYTHSGNILNPNSLSKNRLYWQGQTGQWILWSIADSIIYVLEKTLTWVLQEDWFP